MKHQAVLDQIAHHWQESQTILLTGASNLDGDALGCLLALYDFGVAQGKKMIIANEKPLSSLYGFLEVADRVVIKLPELTYDLIIICDTGSFEMLGSIYTDNKALFEATKKINIDHHSSCYGDVCWSTCSYENTSATMMVANFIEYTAGVEAITKDMATYLLLGVYYDTECFRNANTTPHGLRFAAHMLELFADHNCLIRNLYQSTDPNYIGLYGEVLASIQIILDGRGVIGLATQDMFKRRNISCDCLGNELVNDYLRSVRAKFVIFLKETPEGEYRISLRSKDEAYDMRALAGIFGGGGHAMASGACTKKPLPEIIQTIEAFFK